MLIKMMTYLLVLSSVAISGELCCAADAHRLAMEGGQMESAEKDELEARVAQSPEDLESRTKLLGYYFRKGRQDADAKAAKARHVIWLIHNAPAAEVLGLPYGQLDKILETDAYEQAKQAWLAVLGDTPEDLAAVKNAARYFLIHDRDLAEELMLRGQRADADNAEWSAALGHLYSLNLQRLTDGPARTAAAKKAFEQYKIAYDRSEPVTKEYLLVALAKTAFEAGLMDEAKAFAQEMLAERETDGNAGNRVHHGNLILGRIALHKGDVEEAKSRLIAAGKTTGSPNLDSFGPNMMLAKELLEKGEREVVLEYFHLCSKFWMSPFQKLDEWTENVKAGRVPAFGSNLAY